MIAVDSSTAEDQRTKTDSQTEKPPGRCFSEEAANFRCEFGSRATSVSFSSWPLSSLLACFLRELFFPSKGTDEQGPYFPLHAHILHEHYR